MAIDELAIELEGVFCQLCVKERERTGAEPRKLIVIGFTERQKLPVLACPRCDLMEHEDE